MCKVLQNSMEYIREMFYRKKLEYYYHKESNMLPKY